MKRLARTFGCPTELALELLSGKWKTVILARLKDDPLRYGELPACITRLSDKMLAQSPQGLHDRSLISRDVAPTVPPATVSHRRAARCGRCCSNCTIGAEHRRTGWEWSSSTGLRTPSTLRATHSHTAAFALALLLGRAAERVSR